jgi:sulfur relay (sulfurtransferase) complex TusBCD TusD component (DsrE family)
VRVNESNVSDILHFDEEDKADLFRSFIKNGDIGYYAYLDGKCVHRSWIRLGPMEVITAGNYKHILGKDDIYVHYCKTAIKARGLNAYPAVLRRICEDFIGKNVFLVTLGKKINANRSAKKAGFCVVKRIKFLNLFGFSWFKEIYNRDVL